VDCKEFREVLDLYVDDELSPDAASVARLHLAECAACRVAEREMLRLRGALKLAISKHEPPPELVSAVRDTYRPWWRERLRDTGARRVSRHARQFWRRQVALPAPVFALLVVALVGFGIISLRLRSAQPQPPAARSAPARATHAASAPTEASFDFARFDQGGRASLYKERR
jgi:anti-sigma factor RsiW